MNDSGGGEESSRTCVSKSVEVLLLVAAAVEAVPFVNAAEALLLRVDTAILVAGEKGRCCSNERLFWVDGRVQISKRERE